MPQSRPVKAEKQETATPPLFEATEKSASEEPFEQEVEEEVVEPQPKPSVEEPKSEESKDDAALALQKQIDELRKSEDLNRKRAEQAEIQARQYHEQVEQHRRDAMVANEQTVVSGVDAANAAIEKALSDIKNARNDGDMAAELEAQRRFNRAEIQLDRWESAKEEVETRKKAPPPQQQPQHALGSDAEINSWNVPERGRTWAKEHRDWVTEPAKRDKMARFTAYLVQSGVSMESDEFYSRLEAEIGIKKPDAQPEPKPERTPIVSAPVSREVPSASGQRAGNGKTTLSAAEKEAAKMSGVTEVEYARQKIKLAQMRADGTYGGERNG
jgi:hypothetical protein